MNTKRNSVSDIPSAGDYLIASKACELMNLQYFLQMGKLTQCVSNLVHSLQRERGASNMFLGSSGKRFVEERQSLAVESDRLRREFELALAEIHEELTGHTVSSRLLNQIASALHSLDGLSELRRCVIAQKITAESATEDYSCLIQNLIAVVFEAADTAVDPTIAGLLVAMVHLMNGKELCGQERAVGSAGFSSGTFDRALSQRIMHLIDAQERCFKVFASFADKHSLILWQEVRANEREGEIERLRRLASSVGPFKDLDPELADQWFTLMTERMDALKQVEDSVEGCFHARCTERFADARNSLAHQETLIASLETGGASTQPLLVLCNSETEGTTGAAFSSGGVSQQFGRSIFELVQDQSRRLQQMSDELQSAREALEDRKTQEKAVLWLMEHRRISNDEAHRLLRKLAMDQGRKLPEVARALISMAGVLK
ncbi:response regulator receiver protein [Marinobacter guineae]|uniref:Response regulator receiver protein n=1 Tax=Marinobacter guineae TaxID=432303 RepID=A0A2G1VDP3_9GAMM|nr:nitrate- and nitrite sensing domain-containing protein [Marinobacter guineae]PHQ24792.1 response regulator receiver protein [Marinobacter guineae]